MGSTINAEKLASIFHPYATAKMLETQVSKRRFVHYTSAEAAYLMIKNAEVWMRKSTVMNDFMEVEHGIECLYAALHGERVEAFKSLLDSIAGGLSTSFEEMTDGWIPHLRYGAYLTSISEHDDHEDLHGRLSMWRAYGGTSGVAIVLNPEVFFSESDVLKAYTSPVAYLDREQFVQEFDKVVAGIVANKDSLIQLDKNLLQWSLFDMVRFAVLCTKHPGFHEEREWRIIYTPGVQKSELMKEDIVSIRSIPQKIVKMPLKDRKEDGLSGAAPPKLLNRIIIGPSDLAFDIRETFVHLLDEAGVQDPDAKVVVSGIPLRTIA